MTMLKSLTIAFIRVYQYVISPLTPPSCRYMPSCSHYAAEAVGRHGAAIGLYLTIRRLLRCHPFGGSGFDPVPEVFHLKCHTHHE